MNTARRTAIHSLALFVTIFALHAQDLSSYFIGDDFDLINSFYGKPASYFAKLFFKDFQPPQWRKLQVEFHKVDEKKIGLIRPLVIISYKIELLLYKTNPLGFHLTNLFLYFLNSLLIYFIINFLTENRNRWLGFAGGMFYAVNPALFQAAWMAVRGDIMATFFQLLSFYLFLLYRARGSSRYYVLSLLSFLLGLYTKESVLVFPLLLILYDIFQDFKLESVQLEVRSNLLSVIRKNIRAWIPFAFILLFYITARFVSFGGFGGYGDTHKKIDIASKLFDLVLNIYYIFFAAPFDAQNGMIGTLTKPQIYRGLLLFLAVFLPLLIVGLRRMDWRLVNFGLLWFTVSYIPIFFHPYIPIWALFGPLVGASCFLVALVFAVPWQTARILAPGFLLFFFGAYQFNYISHFKQASLATKRIKDGIETATNKAQPGDTLIVADVPEHYKTSFVYPLDSNFESALKRPFVSSDLIERFNIKRVFSVPRLVMLPHMLMDQAMRNLTVKNGHVHLLRWDQKAVTLREYEIPFFISHLSRADIQTTTPLNIGVDFFEIHGDIRLSLFEYTPSKITYKLKVPDKASLSFGIGIRPEAWRLSDGVLFEVTAKENDKEEKLFSKYIDPRKSDDRRWHDHIVSLANYANKEISLSLVTLPGPSGDANYDWSIWGGLQLHSESENQAVVKAE